MPFVFTALELLQGEDPWVGVAGILAGHCYYYLTDVVPRITGRSPVATPHWLARLCLRYNVGRVPVAAAGPLPNPSDAGFRAFTGRGRRLAD